MNAGKDVENRSWSSAFRGEILIHAGKKFDHSGFGWLNQNQQFLNCALPANEKKFITGGIIGKVEVIDCVNDYISRWWAGPFGFILRNPQILEFKPMPGKLGFFETEY